MSAFQRQYICFMCLHVRTGTIFIGNVQAIIFALKIALTLVIAMRPHIIPSIEVNDKSYYFERSSIGSSDNNFNDSIVLSVPNTREISSRVFNPFFFLCIYFFSLSFCCLLVYGAISRRPTHLLPYFCMAVFSFILNLLDLIEKMSAARFRETVLAMNGDNSRSFNHVALSTANVAYNCLKLALEAYCICVVWDCYKYLMLTNQQQNQYRDRRELASRLFSGIFPPNSSFWSANRGRSPSNLSETREDGHRINSPLFGGVLPSPRVEPKKLLEKVEDLPDYEAALKIPVNAFAPPPYFSTETNEASANPASNDGDAASVEQPAPRPSTSAPDYSSVMEESRKEEMSPKKD